MTSVVEESFAPRLVVDNTSVEESTEEFFVPDYSGTETIIESASLFSAITGEEGFHGL